MSVKVTIIGLGHIGASIGLALADHKDQVTTTGHDKSAETARDAAKLGAVEKVAYNLPASVDGADIIILALPLDQIQDTLKYIYRDVREEAVIMDTAPAKVKVAGWIRDILPPKRYYVGLTPALNPKVLEDPGRGLASARADLFSKGVIGISAPAGTEGDALKLAANFASLLGSEPFFMDLEEADGIMASAHFLPAFAAAALAETNMGQPGWGDIRKVAGKAQAAVLRLLEIEEPAALAEMAQINRVHALRVIDGYIATLQSLRDEMAGEEKKGLRPRLEKTGKEMEQWMVDRQQGNWHAGDLVKQETPRMRDILKQQIGGLDKLFGFRGKKKDKDQES
jgi:prephenate dehydrogenase